MSQTVSNMRRLQGRLFPSGVNAYYRCPKKFHFRYFVKPDLPYRFKPHLAFGGATHKILAQQFRARQSGCDAPAIQHSAREYLTSESKRAPNSPAFVEQYLDQTIAHVQTGLSRIPDDSTVFAVEKQFSHRFTTGRLGENVALVAQVDLVFRHANGLLEHVDFKTGGQKGDPFQNFICRLGVVSETGVGGDDLITSNVMTATGEYVQVPSSKDANAPIWETLKGVVEGIAHDQEWAPRPEPAICRWCEFNSICERADLGSDADGWSDDC